jgi:RNA polymerase sigma-70 factor (ECF subfamily)
MQVPDGHHPDLATLVIKSQHGDRAAFERLVGATARLVYAQVVAVVRDRQRAEDLAQETFLAAWRRIDSVQQPAGIVAWLLTLARNTALDGVKFEGRRKRRAVPAGAAAGGAAGPDLCADGAPLPPEALAKAEARDRALQLLEELPEEYRRPLAMRYLGGADYDTIRRTLGLSDGALRGLLSRGMAVLRERMTRGDLIK